MVFWYISYYLDMCFIRRFNIPTICFKEWLVKIMKIRELRTGSCGISFDNCQQYDKKPLSILWIYFSHQTTYCHAIHPIPNSLLISMMCGTLSNVLLMSRYVNSLTEVIYSTTRSDWSAKTLDKSVFISDNSHIVLR